MVHKQADVHLITEPNTTAIKYLFKDVLLNAPDQRRKNMMAAVQTMKC